MATINRLLIPFLVSGAIFSTGALARLDPEGPQTAVAYRDLDLATPAGVRALHHRVDQAAARICGDFDPRDLVRMGQVMSCRRVAVASAAPQIDVVLAAARSGTAYAANNATIRLGH